MSVPETEYSSRIHEGEVSENIPANYAPVCALDYWRGVRAMAVKFAECVNSHGGDCTVIDLPKIGITGNEHFIFQDKNNDVVAEHIANWLKSKEM